MKKNMFNPLFIAIGLFLLNYHYYCYANIFQWETNEIDGINNVQDFVRNDSLLCLVGNTINGMLIYTSNDRGYNWEKIYGLPTDAGAYPPSNYISKSGRTISKTSNEVIVLGNKRFYSEETDSYSIYRYYFCVIDIANYNYFDTIPLDSNFQAVYGYDFVNRNVGIIFNTDSLKNHKILLTVDGMQTWNEILSLSSNKLHIYDHSMQSKDNITFLSYEQENYNSPETNHCFHSTKDGGENWNIVELSSFITNDYDKISFTDIKFSNEKVGYLLGNRVSNLISYSIILKTIDGGITWETFLDTMLIGNFNCYFLNLETINAHTLAIYNSVNCHCILYTFDGGLSWELTPYEEKIDPSKLTFCDTNEMLGITNLTKLTLFRGKRYTLIHEPAELSSLILYPNPTSKSVTFDIPKDQILNNLELFALNGNLLCKFNTGATTLDLSAYNSGEYYLCFTLNSTKYYRSIILSK